MEFGAQVGCYRNTWDNIGKMRDIHQVVLADITLGC